MARIDEKAIHPTVAFAIVRLSFYFLIAALVCFDGPGNASAQKKQELGVESLIYVGTHTGAPSPQPSPVEGEGVKEGEKSTGEKSTALRNTAKGIYLFRMRTSDDPNIPEFVTVTPLGLVAETVNPTFLEIDAKRRLLFCVNEVANFEGSQCGAVSAYAIDPASGKLTLVNQRSSMGAGPCDLALDREGKYLLVANDGGSVAVLPVGPDGILGEATDVKQHTGKSAHPERQTAAHPRGVTLSPDNRFAFVCGLGLDKIMIYRFDADNGKLTPNEPAFASFKAGAGPGHMVFRPDGKFAYVVNELDSTVTALAYDAQSGALKELQTISTLPGYYDGPNTAMWIGVHPSGKNLLVSNCGHQSVVLLTIDADKGTLTYVEDQSTYGRTPVHFGTDTAGKHVVVANHDSGSILILRAPENARVKPAGNVMETPSPTCAKFLQR